LSWPVEANRPGPPAGEVHVWRAELDGGETSRWPLRTVLARYLDEDPAAIELRAGEHGKPALADTAARLDFNLSHSGPLALIAVASGLELGIDVERIKPDRDFLALAERWLGPDETALLREREPTDRASAFYAAWVRREALLKCGGGGFGNPVPDRAVTVRGLEIDAGYAAALAVAGTDAVPFRCFSLGSP
jgi:4'-phosphopantetheinyl transferase